MSEANSAHLIRRGLVIAGGGAKGAYTFGCLKALRELGLEFGAVAGTSAGALNAAIWSIGDMDAGERLWSSISPASAYERRGLLKFLPRPLARAIGSVIVVISLLVARADGVPIGSGLDRTLALIAAVLVGIVMTTIAAAPALLLFPTPGLAEISVPKALAMGLLLCFPLVLLSIMIIGIGGEKTNQRPHGLGKFVFIILWATTATYPMVYVSEYHLDLARLGQALFILAFAMWMVVAFFLAWVFAILLLIPLIPFMGMTALSNDPLLRTVSGFLKSGEMRIPTIVTTARLLPVFDPDRPTWAAADRSIRPYDEPYLGPWKPDPAHSWVPAYVRIDGGSPEQQATFLMASAALPFGIVRPVVIGGTSYVDGGIIDNLPILPLLEYRFDELYVLTLHPACAADEKLLAPERCARLLRLLSLLRRPLPGDIPNRDAAYFPRDPPERVPLPDVGPWPRLVVLRPTRSLGGVFSGLLNFSASYAERMIAEGYSDTIERLSRQRRPEPASGRLELT